MSIQKTNRAGRAAGAVAVFLILTSGGTIAQGKVQNLAVQSDLQVGTDWTATVSYMQEQTGMAGADDVFDRRRIAGRKDRAADRHGGGELASPHDVEKVRPRSVVRDARGSFR